MPPKRAATSPIAAEIVTAVKSMNHWRDSLNPLRGLTISSVVAMREAFDRGEMADIQWAFRAIERSDADLLALVERRTATILEMDWDIKTIAEDRPGYDEATAQRQKQALLEAYNRIGNLYEAIEHLSMAVFRGYAHVEKVTADDGTIIALQPVDQWNVLRDGSAPRWKYNPEARSLSYASQAGGLVEMPPERFIGMTHARPIDFYALPKFVRTGLGEKDWTAFAEIYNIPSGVVTMPQNVPSGHEDDYAKLASKIASGHPGALPYGSIYTPNESPRGVNPFRAYLDYFTEKLVLVGTGGLLTMLTQAGSGTLAGGAHADAFRQIGKGHARRISEALQKQFDAQVLGSLFPGQPVLAYFSMDFQAESDTSTTVDHALKLSQAGYQISREELSERTGYDLDEPAEEPVVADPTGQPATADDSGRPASADDDGQATEAAVAKTLRNRLRKMEEEWLLTSRL